MKDDSNRLGTPSVASLHMRARKVCFLGAFSAGRALGWSTEAHRGIEAYRENEASPTHSAASYKEKQGRGFATGTSPVLYSRAASCPSLCCVRCSAGEGASPRPHGEAASPVPLSITVGDTSNTGTLSVGLFVLAGDCRDRTWGGPGPHRPHGGKRCCLVSPRGCCSSCCRWFCASCL